MSEKEIDQPTGVETTGHEWDGIKELNNPLPRWWLIVFWISVVWSVVYWILMPSWPGLTGHFAGLRGHTERANVAAAMEQLGAQRTEQMQQLLGVRSIQEIERDPQLFEYTMAAGKSLFGDNCATCHGAGGQGVKGYPSLIDDAWLWGGSLDEIATTLRVGIRSTHDETRFNLMPSYGRDGLLSQDEMLDLVQLVTHLSGREANAAAVERAKPIFAQQCVSCHGQNGEGIQLLGAPNLTDTIWLYGGSADDIYQSLYTGRGGVMPHWDTRLSEAQITALAVYVHALGGGE